VSGRKWAARIVFASLVALGAALRANGLGGSLWLDEAWVANSIAADSIREMLWYEPWLQTSPPGLLILTRLVTSTFGLSEVTLRLIPFLFGAGAVAAAAALARRIFAVPFAIAITAAVASSPVAIAYSRELKQYGLELAGSILLTLAALEYFAHPGRGRFRTLAALTAVFLTLAYSTVFLVPALVLMVLIARSTLRQRLTRAAVLAAVVLAVFGAEYVWFIRPNSSAALHDYWFAEIAHGSTLLGTAAYALVQTGSLLATSMPLPFRIRQFGGTGYAIGALVLVGLAGALWRARKGRLRRLAVQVACLLPVLTVTAAGILGVYPRDKKLYLFLLPGFLILLAAGAETIWAWVAALTRRRRLSRRLARAAGLALVLIAVQDGLRTNPPWRQAEGLEDYASAFRHLRANSQTGDLMWVPACCKEPFKFYERLLGWQPARIAYGETGWPCCPRGAGWLPDGKGPGAVGPDIDTKLAPGRTWAFYTLRESHWSYTGYDEPAVFRAHLKTRGCSEISAREFSGVLVIQFECP
jgi:4-amino-4-deoxy-L-arabinose transferase-like glycosyltransferase